MSNSVGRIDLDLGINTSGFKSQLNGITKQAESSCGVMSKIFGKLGKTIGAAFAIKQVAKFTKSCLDLGSDLAEVQNVVDVTFGGMSSKVNEFAKNAMTSYGMSEKVAKDYMGQFGAMSKAFGNTTSMAYDQAAALTGLAGDVASFYNLSTDEAFTKLKAVYTGETEALKSLGVVMTQTALDEYALQKGIGKTTDQMSEQEKVALRLKFVTDRLSSASGDFVRTADGWANQTRVLSLRFDALKASIGQGLINVLTPVVRLLNEIMAKLQGAADAFKNFTAAIFGDAGGASSASVMAEASEQLAANTGAAANSAKAIKKSLMGFDKLNILSSPGSGNSGGSTSGNSSPELANTNTVADSVSKKIDEIKSKLVSLSKITGFASLWDKFKIGVDNAKRGVENLFKYFKTAASNNAPNFESLKNSLKNTFITISQTITGIWGDMWVSLTDGFNTFTEEHGQQITEFFTNIQGTVAGAATFISNAWGDVFSKIKGFWESDGKPIFDGFIGAITDVWGWMLDLYNKVIDPVVDKIGEVASGLWTEHLSPLWSDVLNFVGSVGNGILLLWNKILKPCVNWITTEILPTVQNVINPIIDRIGTLFGIIVDRVRGAIKVLTGIIDFLTGVFTGNWKKAWKGIQTIFSGIWTGFWSTVKGTINLIIDGINTLWGGLYNSLRGVINGVGGIIKMLGKAIGKDWGFSIPQKAPMIPKLATGGYVAANTPQLAIIGDNKREGEIVAPESKIAEAVARGFAMVMSKMQTQGKAQNERPIYLTLKIGEDDFWEGFVDYHNSIVKRTGDSPLLV